jgi:hypothetical protein
VVVLVAPLAIACAKLFFKPKLEAAKA